MKHFISVILCSLLLSFSSAALASEDVYTGPALVDDYTGDVFIHNSQVRYSSEDMLTFNTSDYLTTMHPELLPVRPTLDSWAARLQLHPRVLSAVASDYFVGKIIAADSSSISAVAQIALGLKELTNQTLPDELAASRAAHALARALDFENREHSELTSYRLSKVITQQLSNEDEPHGVQGGAIPVTLGYFQPPWLVGESWAGGGVHGINSLDFWRLENYTWGDDTADTWVAAMEAGTVRVWSSCDMSIIHGNGFVTSYYHLDNIQFDNLDLVEKNDPISNYADNIEQALCTGGTSSGPHVHMSVTYDVDEVPLDDDGTIDFGAFSYHAGVGDYDTNCETSWYNHYTTGTVCPWYALINDVPEPSAALLTGVSFLTLAGLRLIRRRV